MKFRSLLTTITALFFLSACIQNTFAQDIPYTELKGHTDSVNSVVFSPDGQMLASGSWDNTIRLWDISTLVDTYTEINVAPSSVVSPAVGEQFTVNINIVGGQDIRGYQLTLSYNSNTLRYVSHTHGGYLPGDIFEDPTVSSPGQKWAIEDINRDGVVDIQDLVIVASGMEAAAAAPSAYPQALEMFTATDVQQWITQAQQLNLTDAQSQRGILFLQQLLAALTPKKTALLPNYPNPFNPETWIPYQLAAPADVTLTIYAIDGTVVRTLSLGYQSIGNYQDKNRSVYWDGKNDVGELVASGVYFYTLKAGGFSATRKMLIQK